MLEKENLLCTSIIDINLTHLSSPIKSISDFMQLVFPEKFRIRINTPKNRKDKYCHMVH